MSKERLLDLDRGHVLPAGDDHVVDPALHVQEAVLVEVPAVARVEPAVGGQRPGRDHWPADQDLAALRDR